MAPYNYPARSVMESLFETAARCLSAGETEKKLCLTRQAAQAWRDNLLSLQPDGTPEPIDAPGRPARPALVMPGDVPKRRMSGKDGFAALIHALTHIEFNAINLAWDAVYRFRDLPRQFYSDWVQVANEEAYHFQLLRARLLILWCVWHWCRACWKPGGWM